jgi:tetratricopeptide (TPR) repeat protein
MRGIWLGSRTRLAVAVLFLGLVWATAVRAAAKEDDFRRQALALNRLTGADTVKARYQALVKDRAGAGKLLAAAKTLVKNKPQPFSYSSALILGRLAEELKDTQATEAFYRVCIDKAVMLQSAIKLTESYFNLIDYLYDQKKYKECAAVCKEFLEMKSDDSQPRIYLLLADVPEGEAPDEEGEDVVLLKTRSYQPVARIKPLVHRRLIQAVAKQGKTAEATRLVNNLVKARPDDWQDLHLKGWVLRETGKNQEAAKIYEEVLRRIARDKELDKDERNKYLEQYRYSLSGIYMELKQVPKAIEQLKALLVLKPDSPTYNNDLGYIMADNDIDLEKAEKLIRKGLKEEQKLRKKLKPYLRPEDDKENGAFLDSLGWVLYKQGKYREAKEALLKAVADKDNQSIEVYDHLGDVYMALKDKAKAIQAWKKGLRVAGSGKHEQERKATVEKKLKANQ